jgi:hypothetical protein
MILTKSPQLVKTTKPTGRGICPPHIDRAHAIDELINERAGTRDLNDSDFDDDNGDVGYASHVSISSDDVKASLPAKVAVVRGVRDQAPSRRNARGNGLELVEKISQVFDPAVQDSRDNERANRSLQNAQLLASAQQNRDAQAVIETLRMQITTLQGRVYESDRARDLAQLKLEMNVRVGGQTPIGQKQGVSVDRGRPKPKFRNEIHYREGGGSVTWITDNEGTDDEEPAALPLPALPPRALRRTSHFRESPTPRVEAPLSIVAGSSLATPIIVQAADAATKGTASLLLGDDMKENVPPIGL